MYKIMDDGMCADKDLPDMESVNESIFTMLDSLTISCLPFMVEVWDQEADKLVERRYYSLETQVTYHD